MNETDFDRWRRLQYEALDERHTQQDEALEVDVARPSAAQQRCMDTNGAFRPRSGRRERRP